MPSSKRVTGNFNFWTGASENWQYFDSTSNSLVTVRRGNKDTVFQSANLVVYGNIVGLGGNIYANITGNIVLPSGIDYGILYKDPGGNAAVSSEFTIDEANHAVAMIGNITVLGAGSGNVTANNISSNRVTVTFANLTSANIGTANIAANGNITASYIRAQGYLNTSGANVLYGNANVFNYLSSNSNIFLTIGVGNVTTSGFVTAGGNVAASYFIGNGSQLTGLPASYGNANVAAYLPTYTGNFISLTGDVITTANVSGAYILGNGSLLTGIATGTSYSNANVANYLPVYNGSALFDTLQTNIADITGQVSFSSVSNLFIPGGNSGQALVTDGTGNVSFQSITATPGNNPGSFQYNSNGISLYGADDFVYDDTDPFAPNIRISNLSLYIFKGSGSTDSDQFSVRGNMSLLTATVGNSEQLNTGVFSIGGLDKFNLDELQFSNQAGNIVVVSANNRQLTYSDTFANAYSNTNALALMSAIPGNIIPSANAAYSLGNATNQWANLWVANNTIYLGNVPLAVNSANVLTVDGQPVLSANISGNITVNGTGGISVPNNPAFRVYGSGNTIDLGTTINGTGNLTINNFAVDYNQGNYLNTSTGVFTAPVAGLYSVHLVCRTSSTNNATSQIAVIKNGNTSQQQVFWEVAANSTVGHLGVSTVSKLAQGDTLTCRVILGNVNFDQNDSYAVAFLG